MIVLICKNNRAHRLFLPTLITGDYIIKDPYGNVLGNVIGQNNTWVIKSGNNNVIINNGVEIKELILTELIELQIKNLISGDIVDIYVYPSNYNNVSELEIKKNNIVISNTGADINYASTKIKGNVAVLTYDNGSWIIEATEKLVFVGDKLIKKKRILNGDIIFICGLKIICLSNFIVLINLVKNNKLEVSGSAFIKREAKYGECDPIYLTVEDDKEVFDSSEYFLRSPRFRTNFNETEVKLVTPPQKYRESTRPAILTLGPQMTMMASSFFSMFSLVQGIITGSQSWSQAIPSLVIAITMLSSSFLWPAISNRYDKYERRKNEIIRVKNYRKYLERKEQEINQLIERQKQVLLENNVTLEQCEQIIRDRKRPLWERTISDDDFLSVRVGVGLIKPGVRINYTESDFGSDDDVLLDELKILVKKYQYVEEAPLNFSFIENRITAIIGNHNILKLFFESILLQMITFYIYSELKIVVFTNEDKVNDWDYLKFLPHSWDNQKNIRFMAATIDEQKQLSSYIQQEISSRIASRTDDKSFIPPYYLIITDDISSTRNLECIKSILEMKDNLGFSLIIKNDRIANLPGECTSFINVTDEISGIFKNDLSEENQIKFKADLNKTVNIADSISNIANIPVSIPIGKHELPKSVGFMEMFGIGNVNQFNSIDRWKNNNPVNSLSVPVGIDQNGELFNMDIHENAYGPHGLIAGTTGSGKSEWIITYILSLAVNFDPNEVQFVIIDYKGGGLALSFVNEEMGMRLPHLVGTITNLDKSEIRRSLASLEAESKRRQRMFNEAREKLNESSMNIYKYQQYYRKGMLDEPLSHLIIISDEFAELKSQEPEFLDQLVSIARIGRSLGIHLILATQKPNGVVDEQMWSNSRFKVCLRVQDQSDSNEMLKVPDAAYLKQTGAFYLQVGLNEFFGLGQSAYAGVKYIPTNAIKKDIDTSLDVINRLGRVINTVDIYDENDANHVDLGEELLNIIKYLSDIAKNQNINTRKLWLDAIPEIIYSDILKQRYAFKRIPYHINPIIGEFDDPYTQGQYLYNIDLNASNVLLYGVSGSGKEMLLQSMIYSIITNYTPQEVNLYIADFGSEILNIFDGAPHIGDIIFSSEKDKINNMVRFAFKEFVERRNRYREHGGNYESYNKYSNIKDPLLVFIINSYDNFKDNYEDLEESLNPLYIECVKYGIVFVLSTSTNIAIRGKSENSFNNKISLKQNDYNDYSDIIGYEAKNIIPKDLKGRGIFKRNGVVYEFQTASICSEEKLQSTMKYVISELSKGYKIKAKNIPMIPYAINMNTINIDSININNVVMGYSIKSINPYYMDLQKNFGTVILGNKKSSIVNYAKVFYNELDLIAQNTRIYLFDPVNNYKAQKYKNLIYVDNNELANTFNNLLIYVKNEKAKFDVLEDKSMYKCEKRSLLVIDSISEFIGMLGNNSELLDNIAEISRELQLFDFVLVDINTDFREVYREKFIRDILLDSNAVLIGNTYNEQSIIDISSVDIREKDNILEHLGYFVLNGKGVYGQMLQEEREMESDEDAI